MITNSTNITVKSDNFLTDVSDHL